MSRSGALLAVWAISVANYGAKSGSDSTAAFNAAMSAAQTAANSGGSSLAQVFVYVPPGSYYLSPITVPQGVYLFCDGATLICNAGTSGALITLNTRSGIEGAYLAGGAVVGASAITVNSTAFHAEIKNNRFDNWDGRAVYEQGTGTLIENIFAQNCLLGANSLATYTGVVELAGTDAWFHHSEVTASRYNARGVSTGGFACAVAVTGANHMLEQVVAETSDVGVYIGAAATQCRYVGVRAELNYHDGWLITGGGGEIIGCHALRNSQSGDHLYNGFNVTQPTRYIGRGLYSESGGSNPKQNWALADTGNSQSVYSTWDILSVGDNGAKFTANAGQSSFIQTDTPPQSFTGGTPSVSWANNLIAANTGATNLTAFFGAVNGQRILVKGDGFTTLVNGANLATLSGSNTLMAAGTWYEFIVTAGVVTQIR